MGKPTEVGKMKVGICVPTYGRGDSALRTVHSIRRHIRIPDYELLVGIDAYDSPSDRRTWNTLVSWGVDAYLPAQRLGSIGNQNRLWHELYESGCDAIVMFEDDLEIIESDPVADLILAAQAAEVDHFSLRCAYDLARARPGSARGVASKVVEMGGVRFSFSKSTGRPEYGDWFGVNTEIVYLTRRCLETVGYMDKTLGPWSGPGHPDYTMRARRAGLYPGDWYISPIDVIGKCRYDLCGRSNCTDAEIRQGEQQIKRIYGDRPLFIPYRVHAGEMVDHPLGAERERNRVQRIP